MKIEKTCLACQEKFEVAAWNGHRKYCSRKCRWSMPRKREERVCPQCGTTFTTIPSDKTIHCSHKCRAEADKRRYIKKCKQCGKDFETTPAVDQQYCNMACYHKSKERPSGRRKCTKCGKTKHGSMFSNQSWCRQCSSEQRKAWSIKPTNRFKYAVNEARRRAYEWAITLEDYLTLIGQTCHYCNGPLSRKGVGLDRKDNDGGYVLGNVVPCCGKCNKVKHDYFTYDEMLRIGSLIRQIEAGRPIQTLNED